VKTRSDSFITLNLEEEVKAMGFRSVYPYYPKMFEDSGSLVEKLASMPSFVDIRKRHKIGRKINILQK
jgi:hypothetical protein